MSSFPLQRREFRCPSGECRISWGEVEEDKYIEFTVEGRVDDEQNYIAVAFSKDAQMVIIPVLLKISSKLLECLLDNNQPSNKQGDDTAYLCFKHNNNYQLKRTFNNGKSPVIYPQDVSLKKN